MLSDYCEDAMSNMEDALGAAEALSVMMTAAYYTVEAHRDGATHQLTGPQEVQNLPRSISIITQCVMDYIDTRVSEAHDTVGHLLCRLKEAEDRRPQLDAPG